MTNKVSWFVIEPEVDVLKLTQYSGCEVYKIEYIDWNNTKQLHIIITGPKRV